MRPHSPNYTLSSHYCPVTPGHGPLIVMGEGWEEGGCERHQIFSGNWSVIVKTSPITLSHVTTVDKIQTSNWKSKRIKSWIISCVLFSVYADIVTSLVCVSEADAAQWISPLAAGSQGVMNSCHSATSSRLTTKMVLVRLEQPLCQ